MKKVIINQIYTIIKVLTRIKSVVKLQRVKLHGMHNDFLALAFARRRDYVVLLHKSQNYRSAQSTNDLLLCGKDKKRTVF